MSTCQISKGLYSYQLALTDIPTLTLNILCKMQNMQARQTEKEPEKRKA
jgi:hypothetical protein